MERHETMTTDQAFLAVVHAVGTVIAREVTPFTTICTVGNLQSFASVVAKHLLEVSLPMQEPFIHEIGALSLFGFLFSFGVSFSRIIVLYIHMICNIFRDQVVRFWTFREQHCMSSR